MISLRSARRSATIAALPASANWRVTSSRTVSPMPRLGGRAGSVRYGWHYVSMTAVSLGHLWHHLAAWADRQGQPPSHLLILGTGLLAAAVVASRRAWPVARTVVTIAHEGGHALAAVATGRRLHGVRVLHTSAGVTVTAGNPSGPGIILTALAGYLAAPLLGLGGAALLAGGHLLAVLLLSLAGLAGLAFVIRNAYGLLAIVVAGAVIVAVLWQRSAVAAAALGYAMTWLLLFGGIRPVLELQRDRRRRAAPRTTPTSSPGSPGCPADSGWGCSAWSRPVHSAWAVGCSSAKGRSGPPVCLWGPVRPASAPAGWQLRGAQPRFDGPRRAGRWAEAGPRYAGGSTRAGPGLRGSPGVPARAAVPARAPARGGFPGATRPRGDGKRGRRRAYFLVIRVEI